MEAGPWNIRPSPRTSSVVLPPAGDVLLYPEAGRLAALSAEIRAGLTRPFLQVTIAQPRPRLAVLRGPSACRRRIDAEGGPRLCASLFAHSRRRSS